MIFHKDGDKADVGVIFVFGSNLSGIHGGGAAREAYENYGAVWGKGIGLYNHSYAIPTKDHHIITMDINDIKPHIEQFIEFTLGKFKPKCFVTRVGCGLAGFKNEDIAHLFKGIGEQCNMPIEWKEWL